MTMTINEMYEHIKNNIHSHAVEIDGNKILGKRYIKSSSFSNFKITFLKNGEVSLTTYHGVTLRYDDEQNLFSAMGGFTQLGM